jgi:hypothetical protein
MIYPSEDYTAAARAAWAARDAHLDAAVAELRRLLPAELSALILAINDTPRLAVDHYLDASGHRVEPVEYDEAHDVALLDVLDQIAVEMDVHDWEGADIFLLRDPRNEDRFAITRDPDAHVIVDPFPWANGHGSRLSAAEHAERIGDLMHNEGAERFRYAPRDAWCLACGIGDVEHPPYAFCGPCWKRALQAGWQPTR